MTTEWTVCKIHDTVAKNGSCPFCYGDRFLIRVVPLALAQEAEEEKQRVKREVDSILGELDSAEKRAETAETRAAKLEVALRRIQQWDCINPPNRDLCCDHPWLRQLVDEALS